ncbi:tripartite tricarboxylate transporter substrate binding protein [soil metagenome]
MSLSTRLPRLALATAATVLMSLNLAAQAQSWPTKPVLLVVPYSAGGPTDIIARLIAKKVGGDIGQSVIVDNRAGAGGTIGVAGVVKSPADGYTFALTGPGPIAGMPNLMKMPYAQTDYQYVSLVARVPSVIVVNAAGGFKDLPDFVKQAKASPGKLNYGSAGAGTTPHIGAELLKQEAGLDIVHVPYKGASLAVTALLGGEIQMAMVDLPPVLPQVLAGKLKILAVAGAARAPQIPDVPTTTELGLPGVLMDTNYGIVAPKGVSPEITKKFRDAVAAALTSDEVKEQFLKVGAVATASSPDEYNKLMTSEYEKWRGVVTRGKITLD